MIKRILILISVIFIMVMLILNPVKYIGSAFGGLYLFSVSVLPSLFPFFVFTKILTDNSGNFYKVFSKPVKFLYNLPSVSGYIFTLSVLSGYPVGAKLTADFYEKGYINENEAKRIASFTSTSGPFFILGTVGASMLISVSAGFVIFTAHVLSALICGLIFARKKSAHTENRYTPVINSKSDMSSIMESSIKSILLVGGYICIFYIVFDIVLNTGILTPFDFILSKIFVFFNIPKNFSLAFLSGLMEVTRGCMEISALKAGIVTSAILCCGLISFGGLCINMQALAFLSKCRVSALLFFLYKFCHMLISILICWLLCLIFM